MKTVLRLVLYPLIILAAIIDACYEVFWYSVIVGRPSWMRGAENPIQSVAKAFGRTRY